jgi:predicted MPP superfamily phosphohydrolase
MSGTPHYFPQVIVWLVCSVLLLLGMLRYRHRRAALVLLITAECWMSAGLAVAPQRVSSRVPRSINLVARAGFVIVAVSAAAGGILELLWLAVPTFNPKRREILKAASFAAPVVALGAGYITREQLRLVEVDIPIAGLPKDLHGLRIAQLSDLHLSPLVSESLIARAVDLANDCRPSITLVTGDLISAVGDPLDACIRQIARLKADAGVFGCMGNHEVYARCMDYAARQAARLGIRFLRFENALLRFGNSDLNIAGVDYQQRRNPYLVAAEELVAPGATNLLLSHNPDVFPVAVEKGFQITVAGHTHGGQINVEILHQDVNIARFFTPYVYGLYRMDGGAAFVTRGIGTIGIPSRLGAPPEVALLRLCAI